MKKWELETLRNLLAEYEALHKVQIKDGKYIPSPSVEQTQRADEIIDELNEVKKLIPELYDLDYKITSENMPKVIIKIRKSLAQGNQEVLHELELLDNINSLKSLNEPSAIEDLIQRIRNSLTPEEISLAEKTGIDIKKDSQLQFHNLEELLNLYLKSQLAELQPTERQSAECEQGYTYRQIYDEYQFNKEKRNSISAKNTAIKQIQSLNDRELDNFIPTLRRLDIDFFEEYLKYLKVSGNYLIAEESRKISKEVKKEFQVKATKEQRKKDEMLYQRRKGPVFYEEDYEFIIGKPNIIREADGVTLYFQAERGKKPFVYKIGSNKKDFNMSSKDKAEFIEKIIGLPSGTIYTYGIRALSDTNLTHKIPQTDVNIKALNSILDMVDPCILRAYSEMILTLPKKLKRYPEIIRMLKKEDLLNQIRNYIEMATKRKREDIAAEENLKIEYQSKEKVKEAVDKKLNAMKGKIDKDLSFIEKVKRLKQMAFVEIQKANSDCTLEEVYGLSYDELYSMLYQSEKKLNYSKYREMIEKEEDRLDEALKYTGATVYDNQVDAEKGIKENIERRIKNLNTKNPNITRQQALYRIKDLFRNRMLLSNPKYTDLDSDDIRYEEDLVAVLKDTLQKQLCGNITYNLSTEEALHLYDSGDENIIEYMGNASYVGAKFVKDLPKLELSRVSGFLGVLKAKIRNFATSQEVFYEGYKNDFKVPVFEEKSFTSRIKVNSRNIVYSAERKKVTRRSISGVRKLKQFFRGKKMQLRKLLSYKIGETQREV